MATKFSINFRNKYSAFALSILCAGAVGIFIMQSTLLFVPRAYAVVLFYLAHDQNMSRSAVEAILPIPSVSSTQNEKVVLSFVGDIMLSRGVDTSVKKNLNGSYDALFKNASEIAHSDILFGNLEGPLSNVGVDAHNMYSFRMSPLSLPAIKKAGFDVLSVANNHMGDWGRSAFEDTLTRLDLEHIERVGGGFSSDEVSEPRIIETHGIRVGFLGASDVGPKWLEAKEGSSGLLLATNPHFEEIIKNAAGACDVLVVSFHWGDEYQKVSNVRQESLARKTIDAGATIVVGHHPHVSEEFEWYKGGFIAYSLGNFIFDQYFSKNTMQGENLVVTVTKQGIEKAEKRTVYLNKLYSVERIGDVETIPK